MIKRNFNIVYNNAPKITKLKKELELEIEILQKRGKRLFENANGKITYDTNLSKLWEEMENISKRMMILKEVFEFIDEL